MYPSKDRTQWRKNSFPEELVRGMYSRVNLKVFFIIRWDECTWKKLFSTRNQHHLLPYNHNWNSLNVAIIWMLATFFASSFIIRSIENCRFRFIYFVRKKLISRWKSILALNIFQSPELNQKWIILWLKRKSQYKHILSNKSQFPVNLHPLNMPISVIHPNKVKSPVTLN